MSLLWHHCRWGSAPFGGRSPAPRAWGPGIHSSVMFLHALSHVDRAAREMAEVRRHSPWCEVLFRRSTVKQVTRPRCDLSCQGAMPASFGETPGRGGRGIGGGGRARPRPCSHIRWRRAAGHGGLPPHRRRRCANAISSGAFALRCRRMALGVVVGRDDNFTPSEDRTSWPGMCSDYARAPESRLRASLFPDRIVLHQPSDTASRREQQNTTSPAAG